MSQNVPERKNDRDLYPETGSDFDSRNLLVVSVISALVYLMLSLVIYYFFYETGIETAFEHGFTLTGQLLSGVLAGSAAAAVIGYIARRPPVSEVLDDFYIVRIIRNARLSAFDRIQLSLFAGAGEELLFRGAIQPLLGIWLTSVIFVGIHGYFKFDSPGHWLFGGIMFGLSMLLGYLFEHAGLVAAMCAHAVYDMIMLWMVVSRESDYAKVADAS